MQKRIVTIIIASMLMCQSTIYGVTIDAPIFDRDLETITISGTTTSNSPVAVEVLKPGNTWGDFDDDYLFIDKFAYFKQLNANSKGAFSVTFPVNDGAGTYPIRVYSASENEYDENNTLNVYTRADIDKMVKKIADCSSYSELKIVFDEQTVEMLGIDISKIKDFNPTQTDDLLKLMYNEKQENKPKNVADVQNLFDRAYLLYSINNATTGEELKKLIEENKENLMLDNSCSLNIYENSAMYDDARKEKMLLSMTKSDYNILDDFKTEFGKQTLLYAVYNQSNYHVIGDVLEQSELAKTLDLSGYRALNDKTTIQKNLNACTSPYKTLAELEKAIKNWITSTEKPSNYGGGGGGGSSSGGTVAVITPTAKPTPTKQPEASNNFVDMAGFEWANEAVYFLRDKGIVSGRTETEFCPSENIKREEFLKLLVEMLGVKQYSTGASFDDVSKNAWYYDVVSIGIDAGIVNGKTENTFGVGEPISRQDMAVMTYRTLNAMGASVKSSDNDFTDDYEISEYAKIPVKALSYNKIINGTGNGAFEPKSYANRASAAKIIYEAYKLAKNN